MLYHITGLYLDIMIALPCHITGTLYFLQVNFFLELYLSLLFISLQLQVVYTQFAVANSVVILDLSNGKMRP